MTAATAPNRLLDGARLLLPIGIVGLIAIMVIPLPPFVLDLLISLDIALSLVVLLATIYVKTPVEFSAFPSVLLLLTVFRLGLNIASTRRILLHGAEGTDAAGNVIQAFGQFVVGGNLVVGLVIFLVLLAVQFVVINHGATRISEVSARFVLDAMPGKQMAIDADLNAGLIDEAEARRRRRAISDEADFFGSMDGAIRFTQRDALAALLIVGINIVGGFAVGVFQAGMDLGQALHTFSILTVGDGLVTAIPALLVSVAGALIATRSDQGLELGEEVANQLFANPKPLAVTSGALGLMALVPGLPTVAFLALSVCAGALAAGLSQRGKLASAKAAASAAPVAPGPPPEESVEPLLTVHPLTLEVGYDLVELAGSEAPGGLLERIRGIRRQVALDLGFVVPAVRICDNLRLGGDEYAILLRGAEVGRGRLPRGRVLAIDAGAVFERVEGEKTVDPTFGIDALWITEGMGDRARAGGYTVVDRTSVLSTHLSEIVRRHAPDLLGRQETSKLLETLGKNAPKLVEELVPERFTLGQVQKILQSLLRERVSIRDLQTIGEAIADCAGLGLDLASITGRVRQSLGGTLVRPFVQRGSLQVVTLSSDAESDARSLLATAADGRPLAPDPRVAQSLTHRVTTAIRDMPPGTAPIVLCGSSEVRTLLRRITESTLPTVPFVSVFEIPDGVTVQAVGQIR